jgi:hypothetical protein
MSSISTTFSATGEWSLALDLLVARSVLDPALRAELLANPEVCCRANGVSIPDGLRLVLTHPDQPTLIREIPSTLAAGSFDKTGVTPQLREPVVYNGTTEYTETNTTTEASGTESETVSFGSSSITTAEAEAEVVVVLT